MKIFINSILQSLSRKNTYYSYFLFGLLFTLLFLSKSVNAQEKKRTINVEFAYAQTSGNSSTLTFAGKLNIEEQQEKNRFFFNSGYLKSKDSGEMNANKLTFSSRFERILSGRLFGFLSINYMRDKFAGFDHQLSMGPGLGIDIMTKPLHVLKSLTSLRYDYENYTADYLESAHYSSIKVGLIYVWQMMSNAAWKSKTDISQSLEDKKKYFITAETHFSVGISTGLSIGFSYQIIYQNLVPEPTIQRTDTSFLTSLIINL